MSRVIEADFEQVLLLPPCLEDWVGPEHPARFIREFVSAMDLDALGISWGSASLRGQPHYGARLLLRLWLYGYYEKIRSSRGLERACRNHMGMIWLCGNQPPDHNTLWRFFQANRAALREVFKQSVRVGVKAELVTFVLHALDGTKIQANVANRTGLHRKALEARLAELDAVVATIEQEIEASDGHAGAGPSESLPEELQATEQLRARIKAALEELDEAGQDHLHRSDPDARVMQCKDRNMNTFSYNNQAVVDEQSRIIVAERTTQEETDSRLLAEMVEQVAQQCGQSAQTTVADAGYAAARPLDEAQNAGHGVLVNLPNRLQRDPKELLKAANFRYDPEDNVVICPLGTRLEYTHTRWHKGKQEHLRAFRCRNKHCPLRNQCSRDRKGRKIELGEHHEALQAQRDAHEAPGAKEALAKRQWLIEPVFGWIKQQLGFRRFTYNGLAGAQAQWSLLCTTYNLRRLYEHWRAGNERSSGSIRPKTCTTTSHPPITPRPAPLLLSHA